MAAKKEISGFIKLQIKGGQANPAPPVGPALGQHGANISAFCKEYNAKTGDKEGLIIPVEISVYEDRSYTFKLKTPPASVLLIKAASVQKGSGEPNKSIVGSVTKSQVEDIAKTKLVDLNTSNIGAAMKIIAGTAANMGISITEN